MIGTVVGVVMMYCVAAVHRYGVVMLVFVSVVVIVSMVFWNCADCCMSFVAAVCVVVVIVFCTYALVVCISGVV